MVVRSNSLESEASRCITGLEHFKLSEHRLCTVPRGELICQDDARYQVLEPGFSPQGVRPGWDLNCPHPALPVFA